MLPTAVHSPVSPPPPRILSEHLETPAEPLALLLGTETAAAPAAVAARAARALLDLPEIPAGAPPWLAPHQAPAARRLTAIIARYGGAVLADAVGLGKSYVALAVARMLGGPFTLVVPAVLVDQWRALLHRLDIGARIITHESLSRPTVRLSDTVVSHRRSSPFPEPRDSPLPQPRARRRWGAHPARHRDANPQPARGPVPLVPAVSPRSRARGTGDPVAASRRGRGCAGGHFSGRRRAARGGALSRTRAPLRGRSRLPCLPAASDGPRDPGRHGSAGGAR